MDGFHGAAGDPHQTVDYSDKPRPMLFRDAQPNPTQRIVRAAQHYLLRLAEPQAIASVTWLSRDPRNANMAALARTVPANHGLVEEVLVLQPDLIVCLGYPAPGGPGPMRRGRRVTWQDLTTFVP